MAMPTQLTRTGVILSLLTGAALGAGCQSAADEDAPHPESESQLSLGKADSAEAPAHMLYKAGNRLAAPTGDRYLDEIQPILAARCVVCHSCTNGPCQLNMTSYDALVRGTNKENPYDTGLFDSMPLRVSDNLSLGAWRDMDFTSVMPSSRVSPTASILYRSLEEGRQNVPVEESAHALELETARARADQHVAADLHCPASPREFEEHASSHAFVGMPWGLPRLDDASHATLMRWIEDGAKGPSAAALATIRAPQRAPASPPGAGSEVGDWERFLNADDLRSQLVARYIYEHTFLARWHFETNPGEFYALVRSRTAPGRAIEQIATDLPTDDPGVARVYYRLRKIDRILEMKTHVVWPVAADTLAILRERFLGGDWRLDALPGYDSPNPLEYFAAMPTEPRARFMMENSRVIWQSMTRGPICMRQGATYAADEYFWVWFLDPASDPSVRDPMLGLDAWHAFWGRDQSTWVRLGLGSKWGEPIYREAFERSLRKLKPKGLGVEDIWDGDGHNPNAWLTFHRHQASTDVSHGGLTSIHAKPRSVLLVSYAAHERIYYNVAARYEYWGNLDHQTDTFHWNNYTRTEGEDLYVSLFSDPAYREELRDNLTTTAGSIYNGLGHDYAEGRPATTPRDFTERDLHRAVFARMASDVTGPPDTLNNYPDAVLSAGIAERIDTIAGWEAGLRALTARELPFARYLPNIVAVRLDGQHVYSLLADRGYAPDKIPSAFAESQARKRGEHLDRMIAVRGFHFAQPHLFVDLSFDEAADFLRALAGVEDQHGWDALRARYAIARNSERLWPFLDWLHAYIARQDPVEAAILDLTFYDKDAKPY